MNFIIRHNFTVSTFSSLEEFEFRYILNYLRFAGFSSLHLQLLQNFSICIAKIILSGKYRPKQISQILWFSYIRLWQNFSININEIIFFPQNLSGITMMLIFGKGIIRLRKNLSLGIVWIKDLLLYLINSIYQNLI